MSFAAYQGVKEESDTNLGQISRILIVHGDFGYTGVTAFTGSEKCDLNHLDFAVRGSS